MDAYKILGVSKSTPLEKIKRNFKTLALELHPDRGGNEHLFNVLKESYVQILENLKNQQQDKQFTELKQDHDHYINTKNNVKNVKLSNIDEVSVMKQFHKVFKDSKITDADSIGYGENMIKSEPRTEINIEKTIKKFTIDKFNKQFDNAEPLNKTHLVKKYNPDPYIMSNNLQFTELGIDTISDYSGKNEYSKDLQYTDYVKAFSTNKCKPPEEKKLNRIKTVDAIEKDRAKIKFEMNDSELNTYMKYQTKRKLKESNRVVNVEKHDIQVNNVFEKVNKAMLSYKS
jgi:curved DNA-binding protein CbpA